MYSRRGFRRSRACFSPWDEAVICRATSSIISSHRWRRASGVHSVPVAISAARDGRASNPRPIIAPAALGNRAAIA